jgi:glycyl-tRNA synthetase beta chain
LFAQRLKTLLNNEGYDYDVIEAVLATKIDSFKNVREKAKALSDLKKQEYFEPLAIAFRRVVSIIEGDVAGKVDPKLLEESGEKDLYEKFQEIEKPVRAHLKARDYSSALAKIVEIKTAVDAFFDQVMVNVKDPALKANRMTLLSNIASLFSEIADFSRIVVKKS